MKTMYWKTLFPESISCLTNFKTDTGVGQESGHVKALFDVSGFKAQGMGVHSGQALGSRGGLWEEGSPCQG